MERISSACNRVIVPRTIFETRATSGSAGSAYAPPKLTNPSRFLRSSAAANGSPNSLAIAAVIAVAVAKGIVERHRRNIDNRCAQTRLLNHAIDPVEQVDFDRDEYDLNLLVPTASNKLVIPDDFVDWKRNVLLRLERNDSLDLFLLHRRQFHKTLKNRLPGDGVINAAVFDLQLVHHFTQSNGYFGVPNFPPNQLSRDFAETIVEQHQPTVGLYTKFCQAYGLRAEV